MRTMTRTTRWGWISLTRSRSRSRWTFDLKICSIGIFCTNSVSSVTVIEGDMMLTLILSGYKTNISVFEEYVQSLRLLSWSCKGIVECHICHGIRACLTMPPLHGIQRFYAVMALLQSQSLTNRLSLNLWISLCMLLSFSLLISLSSTCLPVLGQFNQYRKTGTQYRNHRVVSEGMSGKRNSFQQMFDVWEEHDFCSETEVNGKRALVNDMTKPAPHTLKQQR